MQTEPSNPARVITLSQIIPASVRNSSRLGENRLYYLIRKQYCPRMAGRGLCTLHCHETCSALLTNAVQGVFAEATNPEAVFTYRLNRRQR